MATADTPETTTEAAVAEETAATETKQDEAAVAEAPKPESELTMADLLEEYLPSKVLRRGEIIDGKIMSIAQDGLLVDIGYKSEGYVPNKEMRSLGPEGQEELEVGGEIEHGCPGRGVAGGGRTIALDVGEHRSRHPNRSAESEATTHRDTSETPEIPGAASPPVRDDRRVVLIEGLSPLGGRTGADRRASIEGQTEHVEPGSEVGRGGRCGHRGHRGPWTSLGAGWAAVASRDGARSLIGQLRRSADETVEQIGRPTVIDGGGGQIDPRGEVIGGPHAGEDAIGNADVGRLGRDPAPHLGEELDQADLT